MDLSHEKLRVTDFDVGKTLGTGSFGRVRFVTYKATNKHYALKTLKKAAIMRGGQTEHILAEKEILTQMKHPFIVNLFGTFHDSKYIYLLLEYVVGGEFFSYLKKEGMLEVDAAMFYGAQVTLIFEYCHGMNIIYRDLKPENMLLAGDGYMKLTDFGYAKIVENKTYTISGTPEYLPPEVLLNVGHGKPMDWWALGILLYEMLVGYPPFVDEEPLGIYSKIISGKVSFPKMFDKNAKVLVKKLLTVDLNKRFGCLKNGADDIKNAKCFASIDWDDLVSKRLEAPFKPEVKGENDTSNFEDYADSEEEAQAVKPESDPFISW